MPKVVPRTKQGKDIDKFFKKITVSVKAGDVVIPVLGPTGPGKSTFINNVLGPKASKRAKVSDGLASCTRACDLYTVDVPQQRNGDYSSINGRLIFVDTPGFDDSRMSDSEVVDEITKSLNSLHSKKGVSVAGIVYMLPIFPGRATASSKSNLKAFEQVHSTTSSSIVALATTRWNLCSEEAGAKREAELRKSMWGSAQADALVSRLRDDPESAWQVVDSIIHKFAEKYGTAQAGPSTEKGKTNKANKAATNTKKGSLPKATAARAGATSQPTGGTNQKNPGKVDHKKKANSKSADGQPKQGFVGRLIQSILSLIRKPSPQKPPSPSSK